MAVVETAAGLLAGLLLLLASCSASPRLGPTYSYVMVQSTDGRSYQVTNQGGRYTVLPPGPGPPPRPAPRYKRLDPLPASVCPAMPAKAAAMCAGRVASCWSAGTADLDCPGRGLCCWDGCVNSCLTAPPPGPARGPGCPAPRPTTICPANSTVSTCWSPGVPDLDCPGRGLCCWDGCANTCLQDKEEEEELDEELDEDLPEELDEDLPEELDEELDEPDEEYDESLSEPVEDLDQYGAPLAPPLTNPAPVPDSTLLELDSYGSPSAGPLNNYVDTGPPPRTRPVRPLPHKTEQATPQATPRLLYRRLAARPHHRAGPPPPRSLKPLARRNPPRLPRKLFRKKKFHQEAAAASPISSLGAFWQRHFGIFSHL